MHAAFNEELARLKTRDQPGDDIFSLLANAHYEDGSPITPEHLRDQLFTFLFAGHETTAIALAWALYHIHRNPEVLTRLHQELDQAPDDSPATLVSLPYLKAVVQETLRLYPIVTEVLRLLKEPMELGEYRVPAGHAVAAAAVLAHYQPDVYPEPELFKPERFLQRSFSPFEYMPFGGGHRRCVGAAFSTYEMQIVLGTICKRYRMEAVDESVVPVRRNVTMGPSTGINLRMLGRRS